MRILPNVSWKRERLSMKPKFEVLKQDILYEESQIDLVASKIKEIIGTGEDVTDIKKAALAAYLMNFYNGIENIMKRCAKVYYNRMPRGADWHKELLLKTCAGNGGKHTLFSKDTAYRLYDYLTFRHVFIHGYGFKLKWEEMKTLADSTQALWLEIKECLADFINKI